MSVLTILYFFIPAYIANMMPVFVRKLKFFDFPLDFGATLRGKRLFGAHKTWRGMIFGVLAGMLILYVQQLAYAAGFTNWALYPYTNLHVLVGAAIAFGALMGDALESTVKRQLNIRDGGRLFFWDQLDYMFGALLVTIPYWISLWQETLYALLIIFACTVLIQKIGFLLRLKDDPL